MCYTGSFLPLKIHHLSYEGEVPRSRLGQLLQYPIYSSLDIDIGMPKLFSSVVSNDNLKTKTIAKTKQAKIQIHWGYFSNF